MYHVNLIEYVEIGHCSEDVISSFFVFSDCLVTTSGWGSEQGIFPHSTGNEN